MTPKAILFVDDESNILLGLKRMLHSMRKEMDFYFVEGGKEALELLAEREINVIVSDMRMPGMDGATLLTSVMEKYPQIIRIMLTGHADDQSILRSIPVVHQFLAKPSDPITLKEILSRACALQELISSKQLKTLVAGLGTLPSLPEVYAELQEKAKDPECSISDVADIIEKDLAMSAKVLQLVNSAFYGLYKSVDSPARAVNLLGLDTIKSLVLGIGVFTKMAPSEDKAFSVSALWKHSITTANFAKKIALAEVADNTIVENSFIAGIVHDVGKLLLFSSLDKQYLQAVETAKKQLIQLSQAENQLFDADHGDVGGYLIGLWGLPGPVVEAITFHHKLERYPEASFCPALAVHAADVAYYILNPDQCVGKPPEINKAYLDQAGLGDRFVQWLEICQEVQSEGEEDD
jgi:HD-like signal output (HDOD) protein